MMAQLGAGAGANGDIFSQDIAKNPQTSVFDLSKITNLTGDSGMIIPFDWFETLPKDKFTISAETALETLPTITNILTPYHVRTHWYYMRCSDLWEGFETMIKKGRVGNINWTIPQIDVNEDFNDGLSYSVPHSLQSYLGIQPKYGKNTESGSTYYLKDYLPYAKASNKASLATQYTQTNYQAIKDGVSCLPFMAYQAIWKYNYTDQNLLQQNTNLFPEEGDSNWRIPSTGNPTYINALAWQEGHLKAIHEGYQNPEPDHIKESNATVSLLKLRYAQFEDDAFTTALPWAQRGAAETLDTTLDLSSLEVNLESVMQNGNEKATYFNVGTRQSANTGFIPTEIKGKKFYAYDPTKAGTAQDGEGLNATDIYSLEGQWGRLAISSDESTSSLGTLGNLRTDYITGSNLKEILKATSNAGNLDVGISITANQLRQLIAMSVWQERNAQVNGSYNSMIWIHYKYNPNAQEHYPQYIGGTSDYINFGELLSTVETEDNPQGTAISAGKLYMNQDVGSFTSPDYGIIMGVLIITPMTTYNTTTQKEFFKKTAEDFYFPEFDNLGAMPILNKELYTSGNAETDNGLFGYAKNRYYWMKTRQNVNRGLFQLPSETDTLFSAGTQAREFDSKPELSYEFKVQSPENTRRDWLAYPKEPMFKIQVASKIKAVRPMAYSSQPETFGF